MSKRQKHLILYTAPAVVLGLLIYARFEISRLQDDAQRLSETGRAVMAVLGEAAAGLGELDGERVMACYADGYASPNQGSWAERLRSERDDVRVYDWHSEDPRPYRKADVADQVSRYLAGIASLEHSKIKLALVEEMPGDGQAVARTVLWLRGNRPDGERFEAQAHFRMWLDDTSGRWQIRRQELLHGVTVLGDGRGFSDAAAEAGIDFAAQRNPLFATPEWRLEKFEIAKYAPAGVSAADYDGDGWDDLFFADGASSRLYRNQGTSAEGGATFREVTAEVGLPVDLPGINAAVFADFDNDGDKDVVLGRFMGGNRLYRNDGADAQGRVTFTDVSAGSDLGDPFVTVAAAADYDLDGDLDLYLGRYLDPRSKLPTTLFYTRNGEGNSLLRNDGGLRFTEVTAEAGVREGGLTLGVVWGDVDADGDPDLYVANDFGRNALLRNDGAGPGGAVTFTDVSMEAGALDFGFGMSASMGDADNDGDLDIYVSGIHSSQRWYGQAATLYQYLLTSIQQGTIREDFPLYREIYGYVGAYWRNIGEHMVSGNSLLLNDGTGHFTNVKEQSEVNPFGWYWGSTFLDYDNDGRLDIYAANGWISGRTYDDL